MTGTSDDFASLPEFVRNDIARYQEEARKYEHYDVQLLYNGFSVEIGPKGVVRVHWAQFFPEEEQEEKDGQDVCIVLD